MNQGDGEERKKVVELLSGDGDEVREEGKGDWNWTGGVGCSFLWNLQ